MKRIIISMVFMMAFLVLGVGPVCAIFKALLGGGPEQSYIYPIYGGLVILTGVIVGATQIIVDEIRELKEIIKEVKDINEDVEKTNNLAPLLHFTGSITFIQ